MSRLFRILIYITLSLGAVFIVATVSINYILKNKLENFIETRLPDNVVQSYDNLSVKSFEGSIAISNAMVIIKNKSDGLKHTSIRVEKLNISDIHYWDYLVNNQIHIETIRLENPKIVYFKYNLKRTEDTVRKPLLKLHKPVLIDKVEINHTSLAIYEKTEDSTVLFAKNLSVEVNNIKLDNAILRQRLPLQFKEYSAKSDSIFVKVSPYENLTVKQFKIGNKNAIFNSLKLKTKYSRSHLSQIIKKERDHYDLVVDELSVNEIDFGFNAKDVFFGKSKLITISSPSLDIFRDKLVEDDPTIKPLYSKMLRDLPFELTLDSLEISNGYIKYSEKVKEENTGGSVNFSDLNARISNISNTYQSPVKTEIEIDSHFMENTPLLVEGNFDVQNPYDKFIFKADMGSLNAEKMNRFTEPNLRVKLEGNTSKTYFTIDGNNDSSTTDMKIRFSDLKVTVLSKDGKNKNPILSTLANIFISKDSEKKNDEYREGTAEATRDKTKSYFNFIWISIKNALTKSMTGKNKKD